MANVGECAVVHAVLVHDLDEQSINDIANCFVFCKEEKVVIAFFLSRRILIAFGRPVKTFAEWARMARGVVGMTILNMSPYTGTTG
jgi:hypothetical protein